MVVGGCHGLVAEHWRLKPKALGFIPSGTSFLSFPLPLQRSSDSNGPDNLYWSSYLVEPDLSGSLCCDEAQILSKCTYICIYVVMYICMCLLSVCMYIRIRIRDRMSGQPHLQCFGECVCECGLFILSRIVWSPVPSAAQTQQSPILYCIVSMCS